MAPIGGFSAVGNAVVNHNGAQNLAFQAAETLGLSMPAFVTRPRKAYNRATTPSVAIGTASASVYGCALAAGYAALYRVAIQVPSTPTAGTYPIVAAQGAILPASSPGAVMLVVQP